MASTPEVDEATLPGWYARRERAWVDAHTSLLWPPAAALKYLTEEVPEEFDRLYPNPLTWGSSEKAQAAARAAEARFPAAPPRTPRT